jgi:hypothetical protein
MAHTPHGQHWRSLGKPDVSGNTGDKSTGAILDKLQIEPEHGHGSLHTGRASVAPGSGDVIEAHDGIASVGASGAKPTGPKLDDGNTAANEKFNETAKGPNFRPNTVQVGGR